MPRKTRRQSRNPRKTPYARIRIVARAKLPTRFGPFEILGIEGCRAAPARRSPRAPPFEQPPQSKAVGKRRRSRRGTPAMPPSNFPRVARLYGNEENENGPSVGQFLGAVFPHEQFCGSRLPRVR